MLNPDLISSYGTVYDTYTKQGKVKPKTPRGVKEVKPPAKPKTPRGVKEVKPPAKPKLHKGKEIEIKPVKSPRKTRVVLEGAPKKPLNPYQLFVQVESKKDIYMGLPPRERMSKVAAMWRERSRSPVEI